ncbi:unnamed protein product [Protopolystoma xenopodis]|uniref:Uncharacterized protein n=1 Tax=Protopolystoma xenopodis TaxID=117903 RepID=A0A448XLU6_9PLAT|nr:unnamed protein product [Protopolystoma xenopodis]
MKLSGGDVGGGGEVREGGIDAALSCRRRRLRPTRLLASELASLTEMLTNYFQTWVFSRLHLLTNSPCCSVSKSRQQTPRSCSHDVGAWGRKRYAVDVIEGHLAANLLGHREKSDRAQHVVPAFHGTLRMSRSSA